MEDHGHDAWNYYYRALTSTTAVAKAFGDKVLVDQLYDYMNLFEARTGRSGGTRQRTTT
jgi:hypothetical protein